MPELDQYLTANSAKFEADLCDFLRIASISNNPAHKADMATAAGWVAGQFKSMGFSTETIATSGHPLVYAESPAVPGAPTVLVYGHYDVQPVDPLELWTSPPFEPTRRNGNIYARGATDDKGQVFTHIASARAWLEVHGRLPVQLKYLIEGEEEVGSAGLEEYLPRATDRLACDCVVISDGSKFSRDIPAITYGLRGNAYFEIRVTGPNRDLHSGSFGGAVTNPATSVARILSAMIDRRGKVQIPGFYDDVVPLTDRERQQFAALPFSEAEFFTEVGVQAAFGEEGYSALERRWARPTFDVCGLWGGYQGEGTKTVLPAKAGAKFSFRLVPNQSPEKITAALRRWLPEIAPPGATVELIAFGGSPGVMVSLESRYIAAAARAIEQAFGRAPVYAREGGSIPIVTKFHEALVADVLLIGWGTDDDNAHSPNEKFCLADFHRGIKASARLWEEIGKLAK